MAPLIEVQHLKKYFPTARGQLHAVDDVSFTIERGTTMGVVGESGCGKSTLGRTLIHLHESTDGKILFEGKDITRVNSKELKQLREDSAQIIFQDPYSSLNPRMTVEQTIREPLVLSRRFSKTEIDKETERLMDLVGLDRRLRLSYPHEMDGGRRQRVGIARALALNPKFIVCDEPVSALDVSIQAQILNLLMDLRMSWASPICLSRIICRLSVIFRTTSASCIWASSSRQVRPRSCSPNRCTRTQKRFSRRFPPRISTTRKSALS